MSISKVYSAQLSGLDAHIITIEVDLSNGLHSFSIVGLGDKAVEESRDRVSAAIKNCSYTSPKQKNQKVVISLAPADIRKEGPAFDVAIALAYLCASGDIDFDPEGKIFLGELSLEGKVRKVSGVLPITKGVLKSKYREIFVPRENAEEAGLVKGIKVFPVSNLQEIIDHLSYKNGRLIKPQSKTKIRYKDEDSLIDFCTIRGQESAKRALEIAAAGGHNIAMFGPPGTGKTMLARAFQGILPSLDDEEILEVTSTHSIARILDRPFITRPPFRSPHHTSSYASLVGGGPFPKPGEITLAHRGVLFLDEFPEFDRKVIEALRQPLEDRNVTISRARGSINFPAHCILIASMNPCPCGYGKEKRCTCSERDLGNYQKRMSGPIVDRIDMWISVSKIEYKKLSEVSSMNEKSELVRMRVISARKTATDRFIKNKIIGKKYNSEMSVLDIEKIINLSADTREILRSSAERLGLSARSYHRIIKLSRTIADIEKSETIEKQHILEALQYRQKNF